MKNSKKKKSGLKKLTLIAKFKTKVPIKIGKKTVYVDGEAEFPLNLVFDKSKNIGVMTAEELKKYEAEKGELETMKAELEQKQAETKRKMTELNETLAKVRGGD